MADLNHVTISQIVEILSSMGFSLTAVAVGFKVLGDKIFGSIVTEKIKAKGYIDRSEINLLIGERISELREDLIEEFEDILENNNDKCKSENLDSNDNRYLTRKEFQLYLDSSDKRNDYFETTLSELRNLCNQILIRISEK